MSVSGKLHTQIYERRVSEDSNNFYEVWHGKTLKAKNKYLSHQRKELTLTEISSLIYA